MADKKVQVNTKNKDQYARLEPVSTTNDSPNNSDSTNFLSDSIKSSNGHSKFCHFKISGECICPNLIKFAKAREKRKRREKERLMQRRFSSSSSDEDNRTYNRTYRVKNELLTSLKSLDSSDPSFYTAEAEPSKPPSRTSFSSPKEPFNSDLSSGQNDKISGLNHNESHDQSMIEQMKNELRSHISSSNAIVSEKIKPFFTRLSIIAQEKSDDNEFKECLTEAYQASQQDPKEFAFKLTTILEESTGVQENFSVDYFNNVFTKFKQGEIQNESLPKSFIERTISPTLQSTPKMKYPFGLDTSKNMNKSQASPLFMSTLTRFIEAANQIIGHPNISALKSFSSPLFDSMSKHNDSSFTYLEKKYVGECTTSQSSAPELTDKDKEVLARCQEQLKALEDSPRVQKETPLSQKKKYCEVSSKIDSPCFTSTKDYENITHSEVNGQNKDVDDSILNEYVTQRRRCLETEKMIREIQAASSKESGINCNLLSMLTEHSDYQKVAKNNNKSHPIKTKTPPLVSLSSSKKNEQKVSLKMNSKSVTPQNNSRLLKKPGTNTQSSKKKPVFKTALSTTKLKSFGYTVSTKSPMIHAKQLNFMSPHLKPSSRKSGSRSPSPLPSPREKSKSRTSLILKTPSPSIPKLVITPSTPKFTSSPIPKLLNKDKNIVLESPKSAFISGGKYFTLPGRTPGQKIKQKKTFFKEPTPLKQKIFNMDNIRSPVKDYIDGKDMITIKHVHRHPNSEKKKITPTIKKNLGIKKNFENNENIPNMKDEVGYTNPKVVEDVVVDYSIHLTTVSKKKAFYLQSKTPSNNDK